MSEAATEASHRVAFRLVVRIPEFSVAGGPWAPLPNEKAALLLAMLGQKRRLLRAELAERLWQDPERQRPNLRQCILDLHATLIQHGCTGLAVEGNRNEIALCPDASTDVDDNFRGACERLELEELLPVVNTQSAVRLPRKGNDWLRDARADWQARRRLAFLDEAVKLRVGGSAPAAIAVLERFRSLDPLDPEVFVHWADLLAMCGRAGHALNLLQEIQLAEDARARFAGHETKLKQLRDRLLMEEREGTSGRDLGARPVGELSIPSRDEAFARMKTAWARGRGFTLVGGSGSGKSHLLRQLSAGTKGALLISAKEGDAARPYGTVKRLLNECIARWPVAVQAHHQCELGRLDARLGHAPQSPGLEGVIHAALLAALASATQGGMTALLLDDIHYADAATLAFLRHVIAADPNFELGLASWPGECATATVAQFLTVDSNRHDRLELKPLSQDEVRQVLSAAPGPLRGLTNPPIGGSHNQSVWGFMHAIRRAAAGGAPAKSAGAGDGHDDGFIALGALTPDAQLLLITAAVAGQDYDEALANAVLGISAPAFGQAEAELSARRLLDHGGQMHDLVRRQVLQRIDDATARCLHQRVASALTRKAAAPQRLAHHFAGALAWHEAAGAAERSAREAGSAGRSELQLDWLSKAADWFEAAARPDRARAARMLAIEPTLMVRGSEAASALARQLANSSTDPRERADIQVEMSKTAIVSHDLDAAEHLARAVLNEPRASKDAQATAASMLTIARSWRGDIAGALAIIEPLISGVGDFADERVRAEIWCAYGQALSLGEQWQQVANHWPKELHDAQQTHNRARELDALHSMACACGGLGRAEAAVDLMTQEIRLRSEIDANPHSNRVASLTLAKNLIPLGRYREAFESLSSLLAAAESTGVDGQAYSFSAQDLLAEVWLAWAQPAKAAQAVAADPPADNAARVISRAVIRARAAAMADGAGQEKRWAWVLELADKVSSAPLRRAGARLSVCPWIDPALALRIADEALQLAHPDEHPVLALWAHGERARALLRAGRPESATQDVAYLEKEESSLRTIHAPFADLKLVTIQGLLALGRVGAARSQLAEVQAWLHRIARDNVPQPYQQDFLHRHPVHREVLALADAWRPAS